MDAATVFEPADSESAVSESADSAFADFESAVAESVAAPALALGFDAAADGQPLCLIVPGTARHAVDAALALHRCEELLAALEGWCGSAPAWRWEPVAAAPSTDARLALQSHDGFIHLLCTWAWLRTLPPPPPALAERLHWPAVPVVVGAGLLRLAASELQQLEPRGAVVMPASMCAPWTGALRAIDETAEGGIALDLGMPATPRLLPRPADLIAFGGGDVLCEVRLDAPATLPGAQLAGWAEAELDLRPFDSRASLWRCASAEAPALLLASGRLLPWGDGQVLRLETVET